MMFSFDLISINNLHSWFDYNIGHRNWACFFCNLP